MDLALAKIIGYPVNRAPGPSVILDSDRFVSGPLTNPCPLILLRVTLKFGCSIKLKFVYNLTQ